MIVIWAHVPNDGSEYPVFSASLVWVLEGTPAEGLHCLHGQQQCDLEGCDWGGRPVHYKPN